MKLQHQQASKNIALLGLTSLLLGACGPEGAASIDPESIVAEKPKVQISVGWVPSEDAPAMINGDMRLRLHASEEDAFRVFPRPKGAFDFFEDPPIDGEPFIGKGWQSNVEAMGVLLLRNKVVLALNTLDNADAETVSEKLQVYEEALQPRKPDLVPGEFASYWFWEVGQVRLMICHSHDAKNQGQLVIALGDVDVMNALRMSRVAASQDLTEARVKLREKLSQSAN